MVLISVYEYNVYDLDVFVCAVEQATFIDGQLFADERLLTVGHVVTGNDAIVNLSNKM